MNKLEYKKRLVEKLENDTELQCYNIEEAIYIIDGIMIGGGFYEGMRGVDHATLMFDGITWVDILQWGTVIVPETQTYISDNEINILEMLGYEMLPLNNNHIMGYKNNF